PISKQKGERFLLFFFSSRRRHTRSYGDWSSDVCSSDLGRRSARESAAESDHSLRRPREPHRPEIPAGPGQSVRNGRAGARHLLRSEERRVGKEWRSGGLAKDLKIITGDRGQ